MTVRIQDDEPCPCDSGLLFGECHGVRNAERLKPGKASLAIPLTIIPEPDPETRTVFMSTMDQLVTLFFNGEGPMDLICGACGFLLAGRVERDQLKGTVLVCPRCGKFNDTIPPASFLTPPPA